MAAALFATLTCLSAMSVSVSAQPSITVGRALGPNSFGSWSDWGQNVLTAFTSGNLSISVGSSSLPTYYEEAPEMISANSILSSQNFGMWDGTLLSVGSFGPAFSSQNGNNLFFPFFIDGNGTSISLSQLTRSLSAVNPGGTSAFQGFNIPSAYTATNIGILFGTDGQFGGAGDAADTFLISGASTQVVDAIFSIGMNARLLVSGGASGSDSATIAANQALVDAVMAGNANLESITATYALTGAWGVVSASETQLFGQPIPEPSTYALCAGMLALVLAMIWRKRTGRRLTVSSAC